MRYSEREGAPLKTIKIKTRPKKTLYFPVNVLTLSDFRMLLFAFRRLLGNIFEIIQTLKSEETEIVYSFQNTEKERTVKDIKTF